MGWAGLGPAAVGESRTHPADGLMHARTGIDRAGTDGRPAVLEPAGASDGLGDGRSRGPDRLGVGRQIDGRLARAVGVLGVCARSLAGTAR